jgi:hypothetical protein
MQIAAEGKDDIRGRGAGIARSAVGADAARAGVFAGRSGELFYDHALRPRRLTREPVFLIVSASLAH